MAKSGDRQQRKKFPYYRDGQYWANKNAYKEAMKKAKKGGEVRGK